MTRATTSSPSKETGGPGSPVPMPHGAKPKTFCPEPNAGPSAKAGTRKRSSTATASPSTISATTAASWERSSREAGLPATDFFNHIERKEFVYDEAQEHHLQGLARNRAI